MANSLAKSPKKTPEQVLKEAVERAGEMHSAAIKRANADYYERIKKAMEAVGGDHENEIPQPPQQPESQQPII